MSTYSVLLNGRYEMSVRNSYLYYVIYDKAISVKRNAMEAEDVSI